MKHHGRDCLTDACDYCMELAEDRSHDWGFADDADKAANQYDRYLDRLGGAS